MITWILTAVLVIILSIVPLYGPIRRFIQQKRTYSQTLKTPSTGRVPVLGHFLVLNGRISKRGKSNVLLLRLKYFLFHCLIVVEHYRRLLDFYREFPDEPVISMWFLIWPFLMFNRADYLEVCYS
jgi:hypothetical protein